MLRSVPAKYVNIYLHWTVSPTAGLRDRSCGTDHMFMLPASMGTEVSPGRLRTALVSKCTVLSSGRNQYQHVVLLVTIAECREQIET